MKAIRWGSNDHYFGPITMCFDDWKKWSIILKSRGDDDYESGQCYLRVSVYKFTFIVALPNIVQPYKEKVYPKWDESTVARLGRNWYWHIDPCEYGFTCSDGHLNISYGRQSNDSSTEKRRGWFLPWTQWRHVRHSFYDLQGNHLFNQENLNGYEDWDERRAREETVPARTFAFKDFDGEQLLATTKIEEREWRFGQGYFKWLSIFRKPMIHRSLNISFSKETGRRKGSWKGGTVGHSIQMLSNELHESAFKRYCKEHEMEFIG